MANRTLLEVCLSEERMHRQFLSNQQLKSITGCLAKSLRPAYKYRMENITFKMKIEQDAAEYAEVISWNKKTCTLLGIWPHHRNDLLYSLILAYLIFHIGLQWIHLYEFINDLEHFIDNLIETTMVTVGVTKLIVLRMNSDKIGQLIRAIEEDLKSGIYETLDEKKAYLTYNTRSRTFGRIAKPFFIFFAALYYVKMIIIQLATNMLQAPSENASSTYELPYHMYQIYEMNDLRIYLLTYLLLLPMSFATALASITSDGLLVTFTFHICGQLAVLTTKIRNMINKEHSCEEAIRCIVEKHVRLIWITNLMQAAFSNVSLQLILTATLCLCIASFKVLSALNSPDAHRADVIAFTTGVIIFLLIILCYCLVGEYLIHESERLHESFCQCEWQNMQYQSARLMIICMARSEKPLSLAAGSIFTASLENFTEIVRKSMGFLSVLRTLL